MRDLQRPAFQTCVLKLPLRDFNLWRWSSARTEGQNHWKKDLLHFPRERDTMPCRATGGNPGLLRWQQTRGGLGLGSGLSRGHSLYWGVLEKGKTGQSIHWGLASLNYSSGVGYRGGLQSSRSWPWGGSGQGKCSQCVWEQRRGWVGWALDLPVCAGKTCSRPAVPTPRNQRALVLGGGCSWAVLSPLRYCSVNMNPSHKDMVRLRWNSRHFIKWQLCDLFHQPGLQ